MNIAIIQEQADRAAWESLTGRELETLLAQIQAENPNDSFTVNLARLCKLTNRARSDVIDTLHAHFQETGAI